MKKPSGNTADILNVLAYELKKSGIPLSDGILTMDELVAELKQLKKG